MRQIPTSRWIAWAITVTILGLLLAYDTWEGLGNFIGVANQGAAFGLSISPFGLFVIYSNVLAPGLIYLLVILITLLTKLRMFWLYCALGLMLSALISADLVLGTSAYVIYTAN